MAHVEPDGLPVDTLAPALCDALTDVSTELVDGLHTAQGTLTDVGYAAYGKNILHLTITVDLGRVVTVDDVRRVLADLGGEDAPVLVRGLSREGQ
jgi:hypothetical protein